MVCHPPPSPRSLRRPARAGGWIFPLLAAWLAVASVGAEPALRRHFDLSAGPAVLTLKRAAQQAGVEIVYAVAVVEGV